MSKFWLVELEEDLEHLEYPTTRTGVWYGIKGVNGVRSVTDMGAMSLTTLEEIVGSVLLPVDQMVLPASRRGSRRNGVD